MSAATCSWWHWLRMCDWSWKTSAASSDCPEVTSDAACCSCSSGCTVVEDGYLTVGVWLRSWLVFSVSGLKMSNTLTDEVHINTDLQDFFQFSYLGLDVRKKGDDLDSKLPQCDTGCTASMLGLQPLTQNQVLNLLKVSIETTHLVKMNSMILLRKISLVCKCFLSSILQCQLWCETDMMELLRLLAESWRRGVPLLYCNLELLLPITETSVHLLDKGTCSELHSELACDPHIQQLDGNVSLKASDTDSKSVRNISRLSRRRYITQCDITSSSSVTETPQRTSSLSKRACSKGASLRDRTEQNTAKVESDCLESLSDYFDLMSYLDATVPVAALLVPGSRTPEAFIWTGVEIKDGLLDEMSEEEEEGRGWSQERLLDIQAAVEGLGFHRYLWRVFEAWTEGQKYRQGLGDTRLGRLVERLVLPASSKSLSFSFPPLCAPRWACSPADPLIQNQIINCIHSVQ